MSQKVQNASSRLPSPLCAHTRHAVNSAGRWMKVQGKFKMQAHISGVVMDIAAFKVSHSVGCDIDATALPVARARSVSIGAMDEMSQKVQKASTQMLK